MHLIYIYKYKYTYDYYYLSNYILPIYIIEISLLLFIKI